MRARYRQVVVLAHIAEKALFILMWDRADHGIMDVEDVMLNVGVEIVVVGNF